VAETFADINEKILRATAPPPLRYYLVLLALSAGVSGLLYAWMYQVFQGLGVAGIHDPVDWGVYIVNFVFWVGIAHSGTLISAILFLLRAGWRDAVSRSAEAMTVFAVTIAGLFPLIHLGRVWVVYFILPYPTERFIYPNFLSPLVWDVLAVSTYMNVSVIFFLVGLIPDAAAARDYYQQKEGPGHVKTWFYKILAGGWAGTELQWRHYDRAYLYFAAMATPLVISVHSIVSWDFAMGLLPGWHSTIFPPYFVAGAIHSGLAMVLVLLIPMRRLLHLEALIKPHHFDMVAKTMLVTTAIMGYSYGVEPFMAWYAGGIFDRQFAAWEPFGWVGPVYWSLILLNVLVPALLIFRKFRADSRALMLIALAVVIGMWLERFMIVTASTSHDFMPHNWDSYFPTWVEITITFGAFCLFFLLFLLFAKLLPTVPMADLKARQEEAAGTVGEEGESDQAPLLAAGAAGPGGDGSVMLAVYGEAGRLVDGVRRLRDAGFLHIETFSPIRLPALLGELHLTRSPIRVISLLGAISGMAGGFWLAGGTAAVNNLIVGGKGPDSWIPFCIPAFEGTILLGSFANFLGLIFLARLWPWRKHARYDLRFSRDKFGLVVTCPPTLKERAAEVLAPTGMEEFHAD